jgi:hypothetical protein
VSTVLITISHSGQYINVLCKLQKPELEMLQNLNVIHGDEATKKISCALLVQMIQKRPKVTTR